MDGEYDGRSSGSLRSPYGSSRTHELPNSRNSMYHSENTSFAFSNLDGDSTVGDAEGKIVQDVQETRLVIGLDYGTTYTGTLEVETSLQKSLHTHR